MDDKEIEQRYYVTKKNNRALTYEEVKDPEYDYWGRARYWYFHQALCLLAGLIPVDKRAFSCFANSTSPLYYLMLLRYYPIREQDVVLLKNLLKLLKPVIESGSIPSKIEYQDIMEHPNIIDFFKRCMDAEGNLKEYAPKTTQNWFREVKKLKSGRPRKKVAS